LRDIHVAWALGHEALLLIVKSLHTDSLLLLSLLLANEEVGKASKKTNSTNDYKGNAGLCACA
jgi:hypothetical protein